MKKRINVNKNMKSADISKEDKLKVWKKILLFSVIFPPYAIYLFLFKTNVVLWVKVLAVVIISMILMLILDVGLNPNRVHNEVMYQEILEEKSIGNIDIGDVYLIEKRNDFKYKEKEYLSSVMYDENNMYFAVFESLEYNKKYSLSYLYKLDSYEDVLYGGELFKEFGNVHPFVIEEILSNEDFKFLALEKVKGSEISEPNLFYNNKSQFVSFSNVEIKFVFNDYGVIKYSSKDGLIESEDIPDRLYNTQFSSVYDVLYRNFGDDYNIVGYNYYKGIHSFNIEVGDTKYIVEYIYGKGASLQSIDDESIYMSYLKTFYE